MPRTGQHPHQLVLRAVGVLVFIYKNVLKAPVVIIPHRGDSLQQAHGFKQKVIKIERVRLSQLFAIFLVNVGHALGLGIGRMQVNFLRVEHMILGPGNVPQN